MSVMLGMASIDERGKARGGTPGDQTGREVYIRPWYDKHWDTYILFNDAATREKFAKALEAICANNNIGYCQTHRTDLWSECERIGWNVTRIKEIQPCECDCSSLMAVCARFAGVNVSKNIWTGNLEAAFKATGKATVYKGREYLSSDKYIQRGGILLNTWEHVAGVLTNGSGVGTQSTAKTTSAILRIGSKGEAVKKMQNMLITCGYSCGSFGADGDFGISTKDALMQFQRTHGLVVDGEYGPKSEAALNTACNALTKHKSVDTIAREVIAGKWGNGAERTEKLEKAGYDPDQIQRRVNELYPR